MIAVHDLDKILLRVYTDNEGKMIHTEELSANAAINYGMRLIKAGIRRMEEKHAISEPRPNGV
jgi:hypothetical protein